MPLGPTNMLVILLNCITLLLLYGKGWMYYGNDHTWIYWGWCYAFTCFLYRTNLSFIESWLVEGNQIRPCTMTNLIPSMSLSYQYRFLLWLLFMIFWPCCYAQLSAFLCTPSRQWFFLISSTCTNSYIYVRASIPSRRERKLYNNDMAKYRYDRFSIRPSIWQS